MSTREPPTKPSGRAPAETLVDRAGETQRADNADPPVQPSTAPAPRGGLRTPRLVRSRRPAAGVDDDGRHGTRGERGGSAPGRRASAAPRGCVWNVALGLVLFAVVFALLIILPALAFGMWRIVDGRHYAIAALCGVLLWLALSGVAAAILRGRRPPRRVFVGVVLGLFPFCVLGGMGALRAMNCALDRSPAEVRRAEIVETSVHRGRNMSYYARVRSWRAGEPSRLLRIGPREYSLARPGDSLLVTTRRGLFRWEWIERVSLDRDDDR